MTVVHKATMMPDWALLELNGISNNSMCIRGGAITGHTGMAVEQHAPCRPSTNMLHARPPGSVL